MRTKRGILSVVLLVALLAPVARGATTTPTSAVESSRGMELAKKVSLVTGVAISPLLGMGGAGAYEWVQYKRTPTDKRGALPWYGHIGFWLPSLLLVGAVALKDTCGTILPPGVKKPLDVAETVENKVSGLVAVGAFVPLAASFFKGPETQAWLGHSLASAGFASFDLTPLLSIVTVPLAMTAFALVWLVAHVINVLILVSPFGVVDAALKSFRTFLLGLVTATSFVNPLAGAILSLIIIVLAYFLAGWSFRIMVFGSVFCWDFFTLRRRRFVPSADGGWAFLARKLDGAPIRTYGKLVRGAEGRLVFTYRPWLVLKSRTVALPEGRYAVGRGLFYPDILQVDGEKERPLLTLPPRYKKHEEELRQLYGLAETRDTGILKGIKAVWRWWTRNLFGSDPKLAAA